MASNDQQHQAVCKGEWVMRYTPGPWTFEWMQRSEKEPHVVDLWMWSDTKPVARIHGENQENTEANARLIAAAPDLLAALKASEEKWRTWADYYAQTDTWDKEDEKVFNLIQKVIAKAEGRDEK